MALIETLFDLLVASAGAIVGVLFGLFLERKRRRQMANQLIVSRQTLDKVKLENERLLETIREKENLILQMEMQILGRRSRARKKK